ncbi:hypothetical protein BH10CYA1_BH10CYA1_13670 [soil metagenome]
MKIIIALDDSACSRAALKSVEIRCWPAGSEFFLCTVLDPSSLGPSTDLKEDRMHRVRELWCQKLLKYLDELAFALKKSLNDGTVSFDVMVGNVAEQITNYASEWSADLIVVGSQGRSGMRKHLLGSFAEEIIDTAPCDVEVIKAPPAVAEPGTLGNSQNRVLICIDGSLNSVASLEWVISAQWSPDQQFTILSVLPGLSTDLVSSTYTSAPRFKAMQRVKIAKMEFGLTEFVSILQTRCPNNQFRFEIREGDADQCITAYARDWNADLIIIGAHDEQLPIDASVTRYVAGNAQCSVKIIKGLRNKNVTRTVETSRTVSPQ